MRVGLYARKSIVFIGSGSADRFSPYGTGFVGVTIGEHRFQFIVTATHVLRDIKKGNGPLLIRVNKSDGSAGVLPPVSWDNCIDCGDDVSLISVVMNHDMIDFLNVELDRKYWSDKQKDEGKPDCGDEVCTIGLYTSHYGQTKNIPVVRIGHIAAMPDEPVRIGGGEYVVGYLIEMRSIAGLSGSLVALTSPPVRVRNKKIEFAKDPVHTPLGVLLGHHVVESKDDEILVPKFQGSDASEDSGGSEPPQYDQRNTGFGVVTPIETVYDILENEDIQEMMKKAIDKRNAESNFVPDSAKPAPPTKEDNPSHKEDFSRLLDAAARTPKSTD